MGIGRYRSFDLAGDEPLNDFFRRQRDRINKRLSVERVRPHQLDPGGSYTLTVKGQKPAQIALVETPEELLKKSGEVGYRAGSHTFLPGH